jgi:hypothetical protein
MSSANAIASVTEANTTTDILSDVVVQAASVKPVSAHVIPIQNHGTGKALSAMTDTSTAQRTAGAATWVRFMMARNAEVQNDAAEIAWAERAEPE